MVQDKNALGGKKVRESYEINKENWQCGMKDSHCDGGYEAYCAKGVIFFLEWQGNA